MDPQTYFSKVVFLVIGCIILGFGVFLEVVGNVIMLPGEGVVRSITSCVHREFGMIKICVDLSMCLGAVVISLILFHGIHGVGVGTIVSALLVGYVSRIFGKLLKGVTQKILASGEQDTVSLNREQKQENEQTMREEEYLAHITLQKEGA